MHDSSNPIKVQSCTDIDVLLTDINMPHLDGLTLLGRISELSDPPRAVVVSAYGDMAIIRTAMNRGAFDFVTKPIDFEDLEATLAKTVRDVETGSELERRRSAAEEAKANLARYFSPNLV